MALEIGKVRRVTHIQAEAHEQTQTTIRSYAINSSWALTTENSPIALSYYQEIAPETFLLGQSFTVWPRLALNFRMGKQHYHVWFKQTLS